MGPSLIKAFLLLVLFTPPCFGQELSDRKMILKEHFDQQVDRIRRGESCVLSAGSMSGIDDCLKELDLDLRLMDEELKGQELQWERQAEEIQRAEEALELP